MLRALAEKIPPQNITVIDTDLQRTATEFLTNSNPEINVEFLPITPAFENTNISLVQQFIKHDYPSTIIWAICYIFLPLGTSNLQPNDACTVSRALSHFYGT